MKTFVNFFWTLLLFGSLFFSCQQPSLEPTPTKTEANANARISATNMGWAIPAFSPFSNLFLGDYSGMAVDKQTADVYVVGVISWPNGVTSRNFGNGTVLNKVGMRDVFLVKYNSSGIAQWGKIFGGQLYNDEPKVEVDGNGEVVVSVSYSDSAIIDTSTGSNGTTTTLYAYWDVNTYVVKYNSMGSFKFLKHITGNGWVTRTRMAIDPVSNTIYLAGQMKAAPGASNGFNVFPTTSGNVSYNCTPDNDVFVLQMAPNGNITTVNKIGVAGFDEAVHDLAFDGGALYMVGSFKGATTNIINRVQTAPQAGYNTFVAKIANTLNITLWTKLVTKSASIPSPLPQNLSVAVFNDYCYVGGNYNSSNNVVPVVTPAPQSNDGFIVKFHTISSAAALYNIVSSVGEDYVSDIDIDRVNGKICPIGLTEPAIGTQKVFLNTMNTAGTILVNNQFIGTGTLGAAVVRVIPTPVSLTPICYVHGFFTNSITLGNTVTQIPTLTNGFVLKVL
jgi:hypothetical protein